jgi:NAD+ synthase (glutamine-hydrolysing)
MKKVLEDIKVALGQIRVITADLDGNTNRIVEAIKKAKSEKSDVIIFPETCVTGYCCGSLFDNPKFIEDQMTKINNVIIPETDDIIVVLGCVINRGTNVLGFPQLTNSAMVIQDRKVKLIYDKTYPAKYDHHEDLKYFNFKKDPHYLYNTLKYKIHRKVFKMGVLICEDVWDKDKPLNLIGHTKNKYGADFICILNQSYFYYNKYKAREILLGRNATHFDVPLVWVNNIGIGDIVKNIIIYDGGSMIMMPRNMVVERCEDFKEEIVIGNLKYGNINLSRTRNKYEQILNALIYEQKELFNVIGIKNAQVHLSGGIDSALVGYIVYNAMGKDNCIFITNPSKNNEEKLFNLVGKFCDNLGVSYRTQSIQKAYKEIQKSISGTELSDLTKSTIQATLRSVYGLSSANQFHSGIVATGNHTEIVEGWANFHDIGSIGVHSIIGDMTKMEIFEMSKFINEIKEKKEIIPHELYDGTIRPAAELVDASEDPFDYFVRSGIDAEIIRERKTIKKLVEEFKQHKLQKDLYPVDWNGKTVYEKYTEETFRKEVEAAYSNSKKSVFKAAQGAPVVIISPRSRGFSNRETLINWYREL